MQTHNVHNDRQSNISYTNKTTRINDSHYKLEYKKNFCQTSAYPKNETYKL